MQRAVFPLLARELLRRRFLGDRHGDGHWALTRLGSKPLPVSRVGNALHSHFTLSSIREVRATDPLWFNAVANRV